MLVGPFYDLSQIQPQMAHTRPTFTSVYVVNPSQSINVPADCIRSFTELTTLHMLLCSYPGERSKSPLFLTGRLQTFRPDSSSREDDTYLRLTATCIAHSRQLKFETSGAPRPQSAPITCGARPFKLIIMKLYAPLPTRTIPLHSIVLK